MAKFSHYRRIIQLICGLIICLFMTNCTITTSEPKKETTTETEPAEITTAVSNLQCEPNENTVTVRWSNPTTTKYAYSEIYLYLMNISEDIAPTLIDNHTLSKADTSYIFDNLQENKKYLVTILSYTSDGELDYTNEIFESKTVTTKTESISIAFRPGFLYWSNLDYDCPLLEAGESHKIIVDKIPAGYTIDDIKWYIYWSDYGDNIADKSDDKEGDQYSEDPIVTFEEATQTLHTHRQGLGFVIAYIDNNIISNTIMFDIRDKIEKIKMYCSSQSLSLDPNDNMTSSKIKVFYYNNNNELLPLAYAKETEWKSSDESVITVNPLIPTGGVQGSAEIIATGPGTATVTLIVNGIKKESVFTVVDTFKTISTYTFSDNTLDMVVGEEYDIPNHVVNPADAEPRATLHVYISSGLTSDDMKDSPYFEINNGKIKALQNATGWLRAAWYQDGQLKVSSKVCLIATTPLTDFTLNVPSVQLNAGSSYNNLSYTLIPENADVTAEDITFTSNNPKITVDNSGKITAASDSGTILDGKITVRIKDITKEVPVSVCTPVSGVTLNEDFIVLGIGGTVTLTATVTPDNATSNTVTWSSTSAGVATVNNGTITAVQSGITEIWASAAQYSARTTVVVIDTSNNMQILNANTSLTGNFSGYKTDSTGKLSFSANDAAGKNGSSWVSMTNRVGWKFQLNDKPLSFSNGKASADNMTVRVKPVLVSENGNQKVMFVIAMTNEDRAAFRRGIKLGVYGTVKPNSGSSITLTTTDFGVQASDEDMSMQFRCKGSANEAGVSSLRIGDAANAQTLIYNNSTAETFSGTTAGISFSYQGLNFGPGSLKQGFFSIDYTVNEPDPIDVIIY